ncbi:MAG: transketolase, partial [Coriobacteriia bacterium]|nr:transketolase [Coriobacteriia bacterium]
MFHSGFSQTLMPEMAKELRARARASRGTVLTATSVAESGHPGGSMSSLELYTVLFSCARLRPDEPRWPGRDRIIVSHGHTSPGVYAALARAGFFPAEEVEAHFRQVGSFFEGHVERSVPGVEWSTGNLGQGLSAGVGMALGARMTGLGWHTFVAMSDGEQQKGQVAEARRLAVARGLSDITVLVDLNGIQISGRTDDVLSVPVAADFAADGWRVLEIDGHDIEAIHAALSDAVSDTTAPVAIVAHTTIGKGVSFMEGDPE